MRLFFVFSLCLASILAQASELASNYIKKYKDIAVMEMHTYGIPASIKLAQGMLESNWGRSDLATTANNHFGIKCGGSWKGGTFYKSDDDRDARGNLIKSCFRAFDDVEDSYRAHSLFLTNPKKSHRYGWLFDLERDDYKGWARGLRKSGYATDRKYPQKLISIIEKYELYRFDQEKLHTEEVVRVKKKKSRTTDKESRRKRVEKSKPTEEAISEDVARAGEYIRVNNCKAYVVPQAGTLEEHARNKGLDIKGLLSANDAYEHPDAQLKAGDLIFVDKKKRSFLGEEDTHKVEEGESLISIAQMYGMRIKSLRAKNLMPKGSEVVVGEVLSLKKRVKNSNRPKFKKEGMSRRHAFLHN